MRHRSPAIPRSTSIAATPFAISPAQLRRVFESAKLCHSRLQPTPGFALRINQQRAALWRVRRSALRCINRYLPGNQTAFINGAAISASCSFRTATAEINAFGFSLCDHFEIARHFLRRKRQRLFDLNTDHFRKFRRIDCWQTKTLRQDRSDRQAQDDIVLWFKSGTASSSVCKVRTSHAPLRSPNAA